MNENTRKKGYYWVTLLRSDLPEIAEWDGSFFYLCGDDACFSESDFKEIQEMTIDFKKLKDKLLAEVENEDNETAHINADNYLVEIALSTNLTIEQRNELVSIYNKVGKWYS